MLVAAGVTAAIAASVPRRGYGEATDALPAVYDVDTVAVFYETRPVEVAQRMAVVLLAAGRFGLSLLLDQVRQGKSIKVNCPWRRLVACGACPGTATSTRCRYMRRLQIDGVTHAFAA